MAGTPGHDEGKPCRTNYYTRTTMTSTLPAPATMPLPRNDGVMKQLTDFALAYKLIWVRVLAYFFIPFMTLFLAQTETYSDETWANMGGFLKSRLFIACAIAGTSSLVGYIDSSMQRAKEDNARRNQVPPPLPRD